jgi:hypothetical protein
MRSTTKYIATALCVATFSSVASYAPAMPIANGLAIKQAVPAQVETVQFRRWGWGIGAGLIAGAIIGSALASPYYGYGYGGYGYGGYGYGYSGPYYGSSYSPYYSYSYYPAAPVVYYRPAYVGWYGYRRPWLYRRGLYRGVYGW